MKGKGWGGIRVTLPVEHFEDEYDMSWGLVPTPPHHDESEQGLGSQSHDYFGSTKGSSGKG